MCIPRFLSHEDCLERGVTPGRKLKRYLKYRNVCSALNFPYHYRGNVPTYRREAFPGFTGKQAR